MYHNRFASHAASGVAQARRAALANASVEAVAAGTVDADHATAVAEAESQRDDAPDVDAARVDVRPHPRAVIDSTLLSFEVLRAEAEGDDGRAFVDGLSRMGRDGIPVRWTALGPCLQAVIEETGVKPVDEEARARFAGLLGRAAHLLVPAGGRGSKRQARRGKAQTFCDPRT